MSQADAQRGLFVTFEGVDGAGKSTALAAAASRLRRQGRTVIETREPGGTPGAEEIRALLVRGARDRWSPEAELLLFTAARRDHLDRVIEPALARGDIVLCDRFVDSTRAYQAAGRGAARAQVDALHAQMIRRDPDLTLIFDLPLALAATRATGGEERRFESFDAAFFGRLRAAFQAIAADEPARAALIDAARSRAEIDAAVFEAIERRLAAL